MKDSLLVYVNGNRKIIKNDKVSLAKAIMYYGLKGDLTVTTPLDLPVVSTFGTFINRWYPDYAPCTLDEFQDVLVPMQTEWDIPEDERGFVIDELSDEEEDFMDFELSNELADPEDYGFVQSEGVD